MSSGIFILLRLAAVALLFWALREHGHNFFVVLRWLVCSVGVWGAYRIYQEGDSDKWLLVGFHLALVIVFNPLLPFSFDKSTWQVIDVLAGLLIFMSTWIFDAAETSLTSTPARYLGPVVSLAFGAGLLLVGAFILYISADQIMHGVWLWTNGRQTEAQISRVKYRVEELEDDRGRVGYKDVYDVEYSFTADGKVYYGESTLDESPIDLQDDEDVVPKQPAFLKVEYQANNPPNNRAVAVGSKLVSHIIPSILLGAVGLWPAIVGFNACKKILIDWRKPVPTATD